LELWILSLAQQTLPTESFPSALWKLINPEKSRARHPRNAQLRMRCDPFPRSHHTQNKASKKHTKSAHFDLHKCWKFMFFQCFCCLVSP
jgi:hypothetical protein